ncbi:MAG: hypothetical protein JSS60_09695 [Verrucomicrobia bacterium]|nr:hypothetical protein [Verrucomicrobiota bacterium]
MLDDENYSNPDESESETNYNIDNISADDENLAYGLYVKMNSYEHHFNFVQNRYKTLANTWMLMTFLAMGYLLSGVEVGIPFSTYIGVMILCLLSSTGIFLLWYLDLGIHHKLLEAVFKESLALEQKYPFLGQSHANMMHLIYQGKKVPTFIHGLFYSSFIVFLLVIAMLSISMYIFKISRMYALIVGVLFLLSFIIFRVMNKKAKQHYETYKFIQDQKKELPDKKDR